MSNLFLNVALVSSTVVIVLVKVGFLLWFFSRSQKPAAIVYAAYVLISAVVSAVLPAFLSQFFSGQSFSGSEGIAVYTLTLLTYGVVNSLVEVALFIWFVQLLLKRSAQSSVQASVQSLLDDA